MYDGTAKLKAYGTTTFDAAGNEIPSITETEVFVQPRGVYQSEFYNAAQLGLKPSITLVIASREDYDVIRVDWSAQRDSISLVCEERVNND